MEEPDLIPTSSEPLISLVPDSSDVLDSASSDEFPVFSLLPSAGQEIRTAQGKLNPSCAPCDFSNSSTPSSSSVFSTSPSSSAMLEGHSCDNNPGPSTSTDSFSMSSSFQELDSLLGNEPVVSSSEPPLKKIEDFISKSTKKPGRRNIRQLKSLQELNPETRRALERENKKILELEDDSLDSVKDESPEIEILSEIRKENKKSVSDAKDDDVDILPTSTARSNGDIVFLSSKEGYPSVSSFHCDDIENVPDKEGKILINVSRMKREPCVYVAAHLVPSLRPHQIGGIRFMYATLIESLSKFSNTPGNGGVLAHSMGLGKTLQVITFLDAVFRDTPLKAVLIVAPLNTMGHWMAEFVKWLPEDKRHEKMKVHCIRDQKACNRTSVIRSWAEEGGVLLMGYEKMRAIVDRAGIKRRKKDAKGPAKKRAAESENGGPSSGLATQPEKKAENGDEAGDTEADLPKLILETAQIVICDEGHRIKSAETAITRVLKKVTTKRRLILTGYPLQNNLMEYWCMIDFVRPFLLGNESEFANLFRNPIENGQCKDSTERDKKIMRHRTYILQRTLSRIVQRRDSRPLIAELPKKREFALILRQSPSQEKLYRSLFEELTRDREPDSPLNAIGLYSTFRNVTHHPAVFFAHLMKLVGEAADLPPGESLGPIRQKLVDAVNEGVWEPFLTNFENFKFDEIHSGKMLFVRLLVEQAVVRRREKIVIFTQSIDVLDYLEEYIPSLLPEGFSSEFPPTMRIDGSTGTYERERLIGLFNDESHGTRIFLISTESGGIGINLTGGNRVVILDVSWNPSKDIQAISRIYRYGQNRISTVYRLVGDASMEKCVFDRQLHKQYLFSRVVDDKSPMLANLIRHEDLANLFKVNQQLTSPEEWHRVCQDPFPEDAKADDILGFLDSNQTFRQYLAKPPVVMDSILEADDTAKLDEHERREAEIGFMQQKKPPGALRLNSNGGPRPLQFYPTPPQNGNPYGPGSVPLIRNGMHPGVQNGSFPGPRYAPSMQGPSLQRPPGIPRTLPVSVEVIIHDAAVIAEIRDRVSRRETFGDVLKRYSEARQIKMVEQELRDNEGKPSLLYVLHPRGVPFCFAFKPDGSVLQIALLPQNSVPSMAPLRMLPPVGSGPTNQPVAVSLNIGVHNHLV